MKISSRERVLLLIMAMLIFVVMPYVFFVQPLLLSSIENLKALSEVSAKVSAMEVNIQERDSLLAKQQELAAELEIEHKKIPNMEKSYNIHYTFTNLCKQSGAELETLNIGDYIMIKDENPDIKVTSMYASNVSLTIKGTLPQILDTAEVIGNEGSYLLLTNFVVTEIGKEEILTATIGIKLFAVENINAADLPEEVIPEKTA